MIGFSLKEFLIASSFALKKTFCKIFIYYVVIQELSINVYFAGFHDLAAYGPIEKIKELNNDFTSLATN